MAARIWHNGCVRYLLAAVAVLLALPALAAMEGEPQIVDGNTLRLGERQVRLYGVDAPEAEQTCRRHGIDYPCGRIAAIRLHTLTGGARVRCEPKGRDAAGRAVAVCYNGHGQDMAEALVLMGWAVARPQAAARYREAEAAAKRSNSGLWGGRFVEPWRWRQGERLPPP